MTTRRKRVVILVGFDCKQILENRKCFLPKQQNWSNVDIDRGPTMNFVRQLFDNLHSTILRTTWVDIHKTFYDKFLKSL
jgi:hypothetical protein